MNPEANRVEDIFHLVADLPAEQRGSALDAHCGADAAIRASVEALLRHDSLAGEGFLSGDGDRSASAMGQVGTIGRYTIIRQIGAGGMGIVYEARQDNPHRIVAVKVLRSGIASARLVQRFQQEANVLGQLQHPGIAQIFEAGISEGEAHPFIAMELIRGESLLEYAERRQLGTRARMALLARVCDAVQHAHDHGVIHRDLKPGNILVVEHRAGGGPQASEWAASRREATESGDRVPQPAIPKILDFGVARITDSDIQAVTLRTDVGQLIGTVPYMSPEQASGDGAQVDHRADIYALGVILYELLSGKLPVSVKGKSIPEAVRLIREQEPSRLSSINPVFRGDVETIVSKCIEKDKTRRYQSAADLAADIRRYLRDEPIVARPASTWYQFRKFARRNRAVVAGIVGVVLVSLIGAFVAMVFAIGEAAQRRLAVIKTDEAQRVAAEAAAVNSFLNQMLAPNELLKQQRREIKAVDLLNDAAARLDAGAFDGQPGIEAAVRTTLGNSYEGMGHLEAAEVQFRRALELRRGLLADGHMDVADSRQELGTCLWVKGEAAEAEGHLAEALATYRRTSGDHDARIAATLASLAGTMYMQGRLRESESVRRQALEIIRSHEGEDSERYLESQTSLASVIALQNRHAEAEAILRDVLPKLRGLRGPEQGDYLIGSNILARVLIIQGTYDEAEAILRECLAIRTRLLPDDHAEVWLRYSSMSMLGEAVMLRGIDALRNRQDAASAIASFREAEPLLVEACRKMQPPPGPETENRKREAIERVIALYEAWHETEPGMHYDTKAAEWRGKISAPSSPLGSAPLRE